MSGILPTQMEDEEMVATNVDMRLARKGHKEPRAALAEQARTSAELAADKAIAAQLALNGWGAPDTAALQKRAADLSSDNSIQAEAIGEKEGNTRAEHAEIDSAKGLVEKLGLLSPIVIRENPQLGVAERDFHRGALGRSSKTISDWFDRTFPFVQKLDVPFAKYFGGAKASDAVIAEKKTLDAIDARQEQSLKTAPLVTLQFYEQKGATLETIEKLNRIGKVAFRGQPAIRARFNKDVLKRGRAAAGSSTQPAPAPEQPVKK